MASEIESARVQTDHETKHLTLFPTSEFSCGPRSPQEVCKQLGLNWFTALKLHEEGWLSFDPKSGKELNESQEAELFFVGTLVAAGCDGSVLKQLLSGLQKPYSYRMNRVYYDWMARTWRLLEDDDKLEEKFAEWFEQLIAVSEFGRRKSILGSVARWKKLRP